MCNISMFAGAEFQDWRRMLNLNMSLYYTFLKFLVPVRKAVDIVFSFFSGTFVYCCFIFFREHVFTYGQYLLYQSVPKS